MENKKSSKIISTVAMLMCLIFSLISVTYSWIKREWTPNVSGTDIKISSDGSLVFSLVDNDGKPGSISDSLGLESGATLKPVSSQNGKHGTFFNVNYGKDEWTYVNIKEGSMTGDTMMAELGFSEIPFLIKGAETAESGVSKYIFLSPKSHITATNSDGTEISEEAAQCMRVAIDVQLEGSTSVNTILLKNQNIVYNSVSGKYELEFDGENPVVTHTGITERIESNNKYYADGGLYEAKDEHGDKIYEVTRTANMFSDYYGGIWEPMADNEFVIENKKIVRVWDNDNKQMIDTQTTDKKLQSYEGYYCYEGNTCYKRNIKKQPLGKMCLGVLDSSITYLQLTVRIWLEGCDKFCTLNIRDYKVSFVVMFDFMDV